MQFLNHIISGLSLGSVYAIIALGYTMVYGIAKMLNFAHGDVIMVGGYISFCAMQYWGFPPLLGILAAVVVCTILGITIEGLAYRPLRMAPSLAVLITAIGVSYFLQNIALLIWGSNPKSYNSAIGLPSIVFADGKVSLIAKSATDTAAAAAEAAPSAASVTPNMIITGEAVATIVVCIVIMVALTLFTSRTKMGRAMRAVAEDRGAAQLMGANVNMTISVTFAIGSALAAIAGVLFCSTYPTLMPTTGSLPGIKAFTAAVFGGIGSIPGAMLGGIMLGIIEIFGRAYISMEMADALVFAVLIIVLLVKPTGLLGKPMREKV